MARARANLAPDVCGLADHGLDRRVNLTWAFVEAAKSLGIQHCNSQLSTQRMLL